MKKVLFVDDEVQILKAIRRIFLDSGFKVYLAQSGQAALAIMRSERMDLIVTDVRMPGLDGLELLKTVRQQYPETVRIVLSGYTDENEVMLTLRSNLAKAYIFKPWNNDELIRIVEQNLQNAAALPEELVTYINNLDKLPTTGSRYRKILGAVHSNKDFSDISAEIEKDQSVVAKVLQIVNSSYYGIKTASVKKALSCIGVSNLENLVLSMEIMDCLPVSGAGGCVAESMWNHAYCTSKIQQYIHKSGARPNGGRFDATAGLLHKIGVVLMLKYYGDEYADMVGCSLKGKTPGLLLPERSLYGFTHADLSGYLLKWWNTPAEIADTAARYASALDDGAQDRELVCSIHIAQHYACRHLGVEPFCEFLPETFDVLGIDRDAFEARYQREIDIEG